MVGRYVIINNEFDQLIIVINILINNPNYLFIFNDILNLSHHFWIATSLCCHWMFLLYAFCSAYFHSFLKVRRMCFIHYVFFSEFSVLKFYYHWFELPNNTHDCNNSTRNVKYAVIGSCIITKETWNKRKSGLKNKINK